MRKAVKKKLLISLAVFIGAAILSAFVYGSLKYNQPESSGDTTMQAAYKYNYNTTSFCPSGTWVDGAVYIYNSGYTSPAGSHIYPLNGNYYQNSFDDWWYLGWNNNQTWEDTTYMAFYRCKTGFATSPNSPIRQTYVTIDCEGHRRTFNTSPRCDSHGQNGATLPCGY